MSSARTTARSINAVDYLTVGCNGREANVPFQSLHEGGVFFLMGDGGVRFISENVDYTTFQALATKACNEILDDEDY